MIRFPAAVSVLGSHHVHARAAAPTDPAPTPELWEISIVNTFRAQMPMWDLRDELTDNAVCLYLPELHDGPDDPETESAEERAAREEVAKQVCGECPVRALCLDYAVRVLPERGIWGGLTAAEVADLDALTVGEAA